MIIAITGSSGFIGHNIKQYFTKKGMKIVSIPREFLYNKSKIQKQLNGVDVIIHLAGFPFTKRWNKKNKEKIYNSRVLTSLNLVESINKMENPPSTIISTSAIGIYNNIHYHDESSEEYADNFVGEICINWENPLEQVNPEKTRVIITRLGIVIGNNKFIKHITRIFKLGLGCKIGHGEYAMPFVHIDDLVKFYDVAIKDENYSGVYNLVAPDIITNEDFSVALGNILGKKTRFSFPYFLLKTLIGERIITITRNPIVIPKRLLETGFIFKYDQINKALEQVIQTK